MKIFLIINPREQEQTFFHKSNACNTILIEVLTFFNKNVLLKNSCFKRDVIPFLKNFVFQHRIRLPFETEAHSINTIHSLREHLDSYVNYSKCKTLETIPSQSPFQITFNSVSRINAGIFFATIHSQNITISIHDVFISYMDKVKGHNENLDSSIYRPSHLESPIKLNILMYRISKQRYEDVKTLISTFSLQ